ncbi:protein of unknown function [Chryseobacterium sp. JV274]|nr:protein of unknown function [Chryseobacterium sp. JV274]
MVIFWNNLLISASVNLSKIQESKVNKALIIPITIFVVPIFIKKGFNDKLKPFLSYIDKGLITM